MTVVGQGEQLGRPATATELTMNLALGNLTHSPGGNQRVEMAANRRGREAKARAQRACALGTMIMQRPGDSVAGAGVVRATDNAWSGRHLRDHRGFHNTIVTYLPPTCTHPLLPGFGPAWLEPAQAAYHRPR